jgi:hypothetical protein
MSEEAAGGSAAAGGGGRICQSCGHSLAGGAAFCRDCGARYEEPPTEQMATPSPPAAPSANGGAARGSRGPSGAVVFLALAIVLAAGGIGAALLLSDSGGPSPTTTVVPRGGTAGEPEGGDGAEASVMGSIEAGRYVQAGSFKFAADAERERRRLVTAGIDVEVVPSEEAQELYPGFQVLLGGPLNSGSEEEVLLKSLHRNGVPSAFARPLTPASSRGKLRDGTWTGRLEESSSSHPKLDRSLPVTLVTSEGGKEGILIFLDIDCVAELQAEPSPGPTLRFRRSGGVLLGKLASAPGGQQQVDARLPPTRQRRDRPRRAAPALRAGRLNSQAQRPGPARARTSCKNGRRRAAASHTLRRRPTADPPPRSAHRARRALRAVRA